MDLSLYLNTSEFVDLPGTAAEPFFPEPAPGGLVQLGGTFGSGEVLLMFWVVFAVPEWKWRRGECCCLSPYILVDTSLMPKNPI